MDLHNNAVGIDIGARYGQGHDYRYLTSAKRHITSACLDALHRGRLTVLLGSVWTHDID
jgi:hypothetical protein